ncbi:hypothetical protein ACELLULO517_17930 [Acidisoma cellulosilytica]|uniref:Secreted protein n=1 Tax=Acidisoma cellulosilyticum TaxID=2802395 RepID=A0A963Z3I1_9PROT|nr:hypothetical protein [Acidisoma cellulosilyticum]MCB8882130.1 hypothetical protein [Acidisoma cellulosilyticum]
MQSSVMVVSFFAGALSLARACWPLPVALRDPARGRNHSIIDMLTLFFVAKQSASHKKNSDFIETVIYAQLSLAENFFVIAAAPAFLTTPGRSAQPVRGPVPQIYLSKRILPNVGLVMTRSLPAGLLQAAGDC